MRAKTRGSRRLTNWSSTCQIEQGDCLYHKAGWMAGQVSPSLLTAGVQCCIWRGMRCGSVSFRCQANHRLTSCSPQPLILLSPICSVHPLPHASSAHCAWRPSLLLPACCASPPCCAASVFALTLSDGTSSSRVLLLSRLAPSVLSWAVGLPLPSASFPAPLFLRTSPSTGLQLHGLFHTFIDRKSVV